MANPAANLLAQQQFGQSVRRARLQAGLTQDGLAQRCTRFKKQIPDIEDGAVVPTLSMILVLAQALEITPDLLLIDIVCVAVSR